MANCARSAAALGLFAFPHIVSPETMQHLAAANHVVGAADAGLHRGHRRCYREQSILVDLVKRAAALVIDRDLTPAPIGTDVRSSVHTSSAT